jgi:hypothetical protein
MRSLNEGYGRETRLGTAALDNRLADGGEVISPTHRKFFILPGRYLLLVSITSDLIRN